MRRILIIFSIAIVVSSVFLTAYSPDTLSMGIAALMFAIVTLGLIFGVFPLISFHGGLQRGVENIENALSLKSDTPWVSVFQYDHLFSQKGLDHIFNVYKDRVLSQQASGQMLSDVEDYINEDTLALRCWNGVITQIPGTLTGLGILGTFIGLITGISEIGFSSVDAALNSVQTLLSGIHIAFYTSIAGVILSIVFNILHKFSWNVMTRELGIFIDEYHKNVIPSVEEQERFRKQKYDQLVIDRLDRIPKAPGFSLANTQITGNYTQKNENILMPQIIEGLQKKEFVFVLQPKYDINTRVMSSAESFVRWQHEKLGVVSPSVFLPILEENGYITKMDEYVWESVFQAVRRWIDQGLRLVPIALNVSKTDILASDVVSTFEKMMAKYRIPPRMIEIEIARNAFTDASGVAVDVASKLRHKGFKVIVDGFDGDFIRMNSVENLDVDELKFDIRRYDLKQDAGFIKKVFDQARQLSYTMSVEGIESMEQVTMLRKCGCSIGQGYFFSKPVSQEEFIALKTDVKQQEGSNVLR